MTPQFSEQLRRARISAGMTQAELAAKVGVTPPAVFNWENGKIIPKGESRAQLRQVLGPFDSPTASANTQSALRPTPFGVWLNRQRLAEQLSVAELAAKSQLSDPAIYNIESGRIANPRLETPAPWTSARRETPSRSPAAAPGIAEDI